MCLASPSVSAAPATPVSAPPPPPQRDPNPPVIDANNDRANAAAKRRGTSIFRNDLSIPSAGGSGGGSVGTGLNVPR